MKIISYEKQNVNCLPSIVNEKRYAIVELA